MNRTRTAKGGWSCVHTGHRNEAKGTASVSGRPRRVGRRRLAIAGLTLIATCVVAQAVWADPCGMVPPIYPGRVVPIARIGLQKTYVFYKDGIETFVIRPGFSGKMDQFGMLIPFPTPPAIRKVPDNVFGHIAAAIDPPEIIVDLTPRQAIDFYNGARLSAMSEGSLRFDRVRVLRQEAVGMYEVAVLEAGSAQALKRWMTDHGYRYPTGMDAACDDYVELGWCFVAVKTRVGQKKGVDPKPGMRSVNSKLPPDATFDGHVQAMGFRFHVDELVVPMRLSAFNEGELHNVVYLLADGPQRIKSISEGCVVRQIAGEELYRNVTAPLPLRIIGGEYSDIPEWRRKNLANERNPVPHNGIARELFASDLLAVRDGRLAHPHEETEKVLLRIGERLGLRGPEIDRLHQAAILSEREGVVEEALSDLKSMTLTVIDGDFPRDVVARENLTFASYQMDSAKNTPAVYDAQRFGPAPERPGRRLFEEVRIPDVRGGTVILEKQAANLAKSVGWVLLAFAGLCLLGGTLNKLRGKAGSGGAAASILLLGVVLGTPSLAAGLGSRDSTIRLWIAQLRVAEKADLAVEALVKRGEEAVPLLVGEATEGTNMVRRGWAIVCLAEIGGKDVNQKLAEIHNDSTQPALVRTWAAAARVQIAASVQELIQLASFVPSFPALGRPIAKRLIEQTVTGDKSASVEELLTGVVRVPALQQALLPAILSRGRDPLIEAMTTAKDQNVRRQAAAYLGTLAAQGDKEVAAAVVEAYRFNPQAASVPWDGGPLFVPRLGWEQQHARALVGNLISWLLWCELHERHELKQPIINNLRSVQLMRAAGYRRPEANIEGWLLGWGKVVGRQELQRMLAAQGVEDERRFQSILMQLE